MNRKVTCMLVIALALLAGCASTGESPLLFGQANTLGISIGASAVDQGGDLILGYKGHNFAVVPVTVGQPDGNSAQIGAVINEAGKTYTDAYSVLGQFQAKSQTGATTQRAGLGTFFATGLAAKRLSDGFARKMGDERSATAADCKSATPAAPAKPVAAAAAAAPAAAAPAASRTAVGTSATERKLNTSLVYAQYQSVGFVATAAAAQQGADLTLGYKDRNIAVVPTIHRNASGVASTIDASADGHFDALSVLGQFEIDGGNNAGTVDVGLGKFFSTGMAAKRLSDGFATKLCGEYEAPQNQGSQKPAAAKPAGGQ